MSSTTNEGDEMTTNGTTTDPVPKTITRAQFDEALRVLGIDANRVKSLHIMYDSILAYVIVVDEHGEAMRHPDNVLVADPVHIRVVG